MIDHQLFERRIKRAKVKELTASVKLNAKGKPDRKLGMVPGILDKAESLLNLPKGYKRPDVDTREDALYALRLACELSGHTYYGDAHPWSKPDVVKAIRAAEPRKLKPFIKRMAVIAFWSDFRLLYLPRGVRPPMRRLLSEGDDLPLASALKPAMPLDRALPADDKGHPLGHFDKLRALFDAQEPAVQAAVIDFVRMVYGSVCSWMRVRVGKPKGRPAGSKQRPFSERVKKPRIARTDEQKKERAVIRFNNYQVERRRKEGFVSDEQDELLPPTDDDILSQIESHSDELPDFGPIEPYVRKGD